MSVVPELLSPPLDCAAPEIALASWSRGTTTFVCLSLWNAWKHGEPVGGHAAARSLLPPGHELDGTRRQLAPGVEVAVALVEREGSSPHEVSTLLP